MGCRNRGFSDEENAVSASLSDALLLTTMCIIGLPVDVHVKDGSIYSGIFYTANVEDDYAIVLKKARITKKGNRDANVVDGSLVETLIVQAEDLVQVVAKGVPISPIGSFGDFHGEDIGAIAGYVQSPDSEEKETKQDESNMDKKHINMTRQFGDGLDMKQSNNVEKTEYQGEQIVNALHGSISYRNASENMSTAVDSDLDNRDFKVFPRHMTSNGLAPASVKLDESSHEKLALEESPHSNAVSRGASADVVPVVDVTSKSRHFSSTAKTESAPQKDSSCNKLAKESKLNPGARIFSPTPIQHRSMTPVVPTVTYIPDPSLVVSAAATQTEYETGYYAPHSSTPAKFVPYNNLMVGNGGADLQYVHPVSGHDGNRMSPFRYAGPYHQFQVAPAVVYPNSQDVMFARMGPLVYMHPVAHDVQSAVGFSQVSMRPLLAPYQVHLPKDQDRFEAPRQS